MRILVVDDDDFSGEMTVAILEDAGYETIMVDSGVEAVETIASDPGIAAVVSDMNMPFISGLDLFAALREEGCTLPFILLSGESPDALRQRDLPPPSEIRRPGARTLRRPGPRLRPGQS